VHGKALMVGFAFLQPYHVMRCATNAGFSVEVLGNGTSAGLRRSRFCAAYHLSKFDYKSSDYAVAAAEIRSLAARRGIDVVVPSDDVSTRLLAAVKDEIGVPTSALPSVDCFDALNDKWNFYRLCCGNDVRVPASWLYETPDELRRDLSAGRLELPITVKPTNRSGALGVCHVRDEGEIKVLQTLDYRPILVQRFILGRDVGINVLCRNGQVVAHAVQERSDRSFRLFEDSDLLANVARMAAAAGLHGPANIDAVIEDESGRGFILECNPRFWYTIYLSMILGLNFVKMSLALDQAEQFVVAPGDDPRVRLNKALLFRLMRPWACRRSDWRMLRYHLADPIPYICEKQNIFNDDSVAVQRHLMKQFDDRAIAVTIPVH
jgi:biotin carboxylase